MSSNISDKRFAPKTIDKKNSVDTYIHTIHTIHNNNNNNSVFYRDDPKILRSYKIHYSLAESFKEYCDFLHIAASAGVELAMMDFMQAHVSEIPAKVTFNLVAKPKLSDVIGKSMSCGFAKCGKEAVGKAVWRGKKDVMLCEEHYGLVEKDGNYSRLERLGAEG
jgi:hypothetical protein